MRKKETNKHYRKIHNNNNIYFENLLLYFTYMTKVKIKKNVSANKF